jgi:hypothetical protein
MDECIEHTETSKKKTLHLFLNNSDSEELTINKFEKTDSVLDAQHWKNKEKLISDENRNISLIVYGRSPRKYRCNSVVQTNVQDLVFYEKNIKLLSRLRAQVSIFYLKVISRRLKILPSLLMNASIYTAKQEILIR